MLVLDANILVRAVLGSKVLGLIRKYAGHYRFLAPQAVFEEARRVLPPILERRGIPAEQPMAVLDALSDLIRVVDRETYAQFEDEARARLDKRDENDWPILAAALAAECPIWTEDTDFFGCGVATWTSDRVEIYLKSTYSS